MVTAKYAIFCPYDATHSVNSLWNFGAGAVPNLKIAPFTFPWNWGFYGTTTAINNLFASNFVYSWAYSTGQLLYVQREPRILAADVT